MKKPRRTDIVISCFTQVNTHAHQPRHNAHALHTESRRKNMRDGVRVHKRLGERKREKGREMSEFTLSG